MRLSGYQPQFFPRLHYFARILDSDIFELSDYVQFVKKHAYPSAFGEKPKRGKSFQADTIIKSSSGPLFLTVPVKGPTLLPMNKVRIDYSSPWANKQLRTMMSSYRTASQYEKVYQEIAAILSRSHKSLSELNVSTILWAITKILGCNIPLQDISISTVNVALKTKHPFRLKQVSLLSETPINPPGDDRDPNQWIVDICKYFQVDEYYYGGTSAQAYMNFEVFMKAGIRLTEQQWSCNEYVQQHKSQPFIPNISIIDLLMNEPTHVVQRILQAR